MLLRTDFVGEGHIIIIPVHTFSKVIFARQQREDNINTKNRWYESNLMLATPSKHPHQLQID